jgi:hypothetical protein
MTDDDLIGKTTLMNQQDQLQPNIELVYSIFCDDVRLEVGNKLTLVGMFYSMYVPQLPATILKFAVLNHWRGDGQYLTEVRILAPDRSQAIVASHPTGFHVPINGFADNVTVFANVTFPVAGDYVVQTLLNSTLFSEQTLTVGVINQGPIEPAISERIN